MIINPLILLGRSDLIPALHANSLRRLGAGAKSAITMTKDLCTISDWTPAEIAARQDATADLAVKAWPSKPK